jgi:hypothetical protein
VDVLNTLKVSACVAFVPVSVVFVLVSEIGPGFSPDIGAAENSGFSPRDTDSGAPEAEISKTGFY